MTRDETLQCREMGGRQLTDMAEQSELMRGESMITLKLPVRFNHVALDSVHNASEGLQSAHWGPLLIRVLFVLLLISLIVQLSQG